jgi:hypothetical protein
MGRLEMPYHTVVCTAVSRQRLGKHLPETMDTHEKIEVPLKTVFLVGPCKGVTRRINSSNPLPGGITGLPYSWGSPASETVKCGHESRGTRT